jgi:hypothetical protein
MNSTFLKDINTDLFITPSMYNQKGYLPKALSDDIETRFGVELEVCVKINPNCIKYVGNTNLTKLNASNFSQLSFKKKFELYFKSLILTSPSYNQIRDTYQYFIVQDYDEMYNEIYILYDMKDIINKETGELKSKLIENNDPLYKEYKVPIFMDDITIVCGDTYSKEKYKANIKDSLSFHFECVTPIISTKGSISKSKVCKALAPHLLFFGLYKPNCFIENYSMGFHVNASLFDTRANKYISIATQPLFNSIVKKYIEEEPSLYPRARSLRPVNKKNNKNYFTVWAKPLYKNVQERLNKNTTKTVNNVIKNITNPVKVATLGLASQRSFMEDKQRALKKKTNFLLEFRLFESRNSIETLCNFTNIALNIIHKGTQNYLDSGVNLPLVGGKRHTKKKIDKKRIFTKRHRKC